MGNQKRKASLWQEHAGCFNKQDCLFTLEVQHLLGTIKTEWVLKITVQNKVELIFSFYWISSLLEQCNICRTPTVFLKTTQIKNGPPSIRIQLQVFSPWSLIQSKPRSHHLHTFKSVLFSFDKNEWIKPLFSNIMGSFCLMDVLSLYITGKCFEILCYSQIMLSNHYFYFYYIIQVR